MEKKENSVGRYVCASPASPLLALPCSFTSCGSIEYEIAKIGFAMINLPNELLDPQLLCEITNHHSPKQRHP